MSLLDANSLTVRRGGRAILDGATLSVEAAQFVAVIGANGAGKSTLLRVLAGLLKPDAGEVALDGRALRGWRGSDLARARAFLPQNPRVDWPITVEHLVALGLTPSLPAFGALPAALADKVAAAMTAFDLDGLAQQSATTLSGGELARAMLARTLVGDPRLLIVDEPIAGLDPRHALDVMARLRWLTMEGRLVIASIHDLTLAARHADRIVALHQGRVVAHGPTRETLTPSLVSQIFHVDARMVDTEDGLRIDLTAALRS